MISPASHAAMLAMKIWPAGRCYAMMRHFTLFDYALQMMPLLDAFRCYYHAGIAETTAATARIDGK